MSSGPGRIERAIKAALDLEPDNALNTQDLCERAYASVSRIDKKHRVAVLRALKRVLARRSDLEAWRGEGLGRQMVVFHRYNVMSYAIARLKADCFNEYRSNDRRTPKHWIKDEAGFQASLREGGKNHKHIIEPGAWWNHTQQKIAERDGDHERAAELRAETEGEIAAIWTR